MKHVHIRTSTKEQTPELQLRDIKSAFKLGEFELTIEKQSAFNDKRKRPVFESLKKLISKNKINELYVWDLDRIYRDRVKLKEFLLFCKMHNTEVLSFNQEWLQDFKKFPPPFDEAVYNMMVDVIAWQGEAESIKKSNRVKNAIVKSEGEITKSYKGNKWGRKAISKYATSKIMELHSEGKSVREIAKIVKVYDKNNNERFVSKSAVHKITSSFCVEET